MSDLAAFGTGIGIGLGIMAVVLFKIRHELAAGWRRLFEEPGEIATDGPAQGGGVTASAPAGSIGAPSRGRTRLAFAFHLLATLSLLIVGLVLGQVLLLVLGAVGLASAVLFVVVEHRYSK